MSTKETTGAADKGNKGADKADKSKGPAKLRTGYADPVSLLIVGLDILADDPRFATEDGTRLLAELADPDRIKDAPSKGYVASIIENGYDGMIACVEYKAPDGSKLLIVGDGRQRTMAGRLANAELSAEHKIQAPYYIRAAGMTALDVARANEWAKRDSPIAKARRAARLAAPPLSYKTEEIVKQFSTDGARPVSKMTLTNWSRLLKCTPEIQAEIESGDLPVAIGYELGKLPLDKQADALAKIKAEGTVKGTRGRENAKNAGDESDDAEDGGEGAGESSGGGGGTRTKSTKMTAAMIKKAAEIFSETEEEPFEDDSQRLTGALFACIIGDDPTGKGLKPWPTVAKHMRKVLRSERKAAEDAAK